MDTDTDRHSSMDVILTLYTTLTLYVCVLYAARGCHERYDLLYSKQAKQESTATGRSGAAEEYGETEQLLLECIDASRKRKQETDMQKEKDNKRAEQTTKTQAEMKEHTLLTLGQRSRPSPLTLSPSACWSSSSPVAAQPDVEIDDSNDEVELVTHRFSGETTPPSNPNKRMRMEKVLQQHVEMQKQIAADTRADRALMRADIALMVEEATRGNDLLEQYLNSRRL
jgi:hypothetical protein